MSDYEGEDMRPFGTFLAVGILALTTGCGDSSSSSSGGYTSPTGRTANSGGYVCKNQSCAAEDAYFSCVAGKCDAQAKTCFGPSYTSGTFAGTCKEYLACNMSCPCDVTGTVCLAACYLAATTDCGTCITALLGCRETSGCGAQATCPSDAATGTGTNCAKAQTCCASIPAAAGAAYVQQCQTAVSAAGADDAACAQIVQTFQSYGLCQ